jgi:ADP-ribose pyrophosphatase YjhB (NUDIX family)
VTEGAAAFIFDDDGRLLVVKENYDRFRWSLPGGALEDDETPEEACARETLEETGVEIRIEHLVGTYARTGLARIT